MKKPFVLLVALIVCSFSTNAFAGGGGNGAVVGLFYVFVGVALTTSTGAVGGGITTTIYAKSANSQNNDVRVFLRSNQTELQAALQIGSGEIIDDFAALLKIPKTQNRAFQKAIRTQRKSLVRLAHNPSEKTVGALIEWADTYFSS